MNSSFSGHVPLREIAAFLERRSGLVFKEPELPALGRKLEQRLRSLGLGGLAQYFELLNSPQDGPDEIKKLIVEVTINETFFFRIPAHFRVLGDEILPQLAEARQDIRKLTIWSAGCSTGEEVYSIAIALLDSHLFSGWDLKVIGTDISENVVERAQKGLYRGRAVQTVAPRLLSSFFVARPDGYLVSDEVRALCEFRLHNLVADFPPAARIDLITFRNVMIYFQTETTRRIMDKFAHILPEDGYLIIGPSETLWQISDRFHPCYRGDCFFYRKFPSPPEKGGLEGRTVFETPSRPRPSAPVPSGPLVRPAGGPAGRPVPVIPRPTFSLSQREQLKMATDFLEAGGYPEAMNILEIMEETAEILYLKAVSCLAMGKYELFLAHKDRLLAQDPLHLETRYLHALYLSSKGLRQAAREEIQKILYADDALLLPRYLLMILLEKEGKREPARMECRTLMKLIDSGKSRDFREKLYTRTVSTRDIQNHCREMLAK